MSRVSAVQRIHDSSTMLVLAVAGGGNAAITDLLDVPGASRTLLEVVVPYSAAAMDDLLRLDPNPRDDPAADGAVSELTARSMARACLARAQALAPDHGSLLGVACTAALVTDRTKQGHHRAHIAIVSPDAEWHHKVALTKGDLDRKGEDRLVADAIVEAIASAAGPNQSR